MKLMNLIQFVHGVNKAPRFISLCLLALLLSACGGGGDSASDNSTITINGGGTKGPLANAIVKIYKFNTTREGFKELPALAVGRTNDAAAIVDLVLSKDVSSERPLIIEVSSDALTTDLTTGEKPVIGTLRTVLVGELLQQVLAGKPIFATPLTTMALDLAILNSNSTTTELVFREKLDKATGFVVANLGFGMSQAIDIFSTPPVLSANNTSLNDQSRIAELRTAVEAMTAMVVELQKSILRKNPASSVTPDHIMSALAADLTDGVINGFQGTDAIAALRDVENITTTLSIDPATLFVPGTLISLNDVEQILVGEAAVTCGCDASTVSNFLADGTIDVIPSKIDHGLTQSIDATVISSVAISNNIFQINFSNSLDQDSAENINNYRIVDEQGNELEIIFARLGADSSQVYLTTAPQNNITYRIVVDNVIESQLPDSGSTIVITGTPDLGVKTVVATSSTRVILTFTEAVSVSSAESLTNYKIQSIIDGTELAVKGAVLEADGKTVTLVTDIQQEIGYTIAVTNVNAAQSGNAINVAQGVKNFIGSYGNDSGVTELAVVGAISTDNNTVMVTFSRAVNDEAETPTNYSIVQVNVNSEAGALSVISASFYGTDRHTVKLTTASQNEVSYNVKVVNVQDMQGQQFFVENTLTGFHTADNASFAGTPPGGDSVVDFDGDGLLDNEEQRGWSVFVDNGDGQVIPRQVTSDPTEPDTDLDGLTDAMERGLNIDPRSRDTDGDTLADAYEFNGTYSSPTSQDTDGDGLKDHEEVLIFKTSPILKDTDGDQIPDDVEIALENRNPRVADLAVPLIEVKSLNLQLDVRFDKTVESVTTKGETQSFSSSLSQSSNKSYSRSNSETNKASVELSAKNTFAYGGKDGGFTGASAKVELGLKAGFEHGWSSRWSSSSRQGTRNEYNKSKEFNEQVSQGTTVTRRVEGAQVSTLVYLSSLGDVAFTIKDIQVSALMPDPRDPGGYIPFATLVPENPDATLTNEYNLGPLTGEIGPIVFTNKDVYPDLVERLMSNPQGVIFKVTNYNVVNEDGRNFAFTAQDVVDRTSALTIDFGSSDTSGAFATERYRVATNFGRPVYDFTKYLTDAESDAFKAAYGLATDDVDSSISFDPQGKNAGVNFHAIMQDVLGFTKFSDANDTSDADQLLHSYATDIDGFTGVERITRIKNTRIDPDSRKQWSLLTPSGLILDAQLSMGDGEIKTDDQVLHAGQNITMAYVSDEDGDRIPARVEYLFGCDDSPDVGLDSDKDGLSDRLELFGSTVIGEIWTVDIGIDRFSATASCTSKDSDQDGLSDYQEYGYPLDYDPAVAQVRDPLRATDPKNPDTDGDGISDKEERDGYIVYSQFPALCTYPNPDPNVITDTDCKKEKRSDSETVYFECHNELDPTTGGNLMELDLYVLLCTTDPLNADTDRDGMNDGGEMAFFANPTLKDLDNLTDDDRDGLLSLEEMNGWPVKVYNIYELLASDAYPSVMTKSCTGVEGNPCDFEDLSQMPIYSNSNPLLYDTDGDGLSDYEERVIGSHPRLQDTDGDGLTDFYEERGFTFDQRTEFFEVRNTNSPFKGTDSAPVITSAIVEDYDADGIKDGVELTEKWIVSVGANTYPVYSSPRDADADVDGLLDGDERIVLSDPNKSNTDEDSQETYPLNDGDEVALGLDPTDPTDMCLKIDIYQQELHTTADTYGWLYGVFTQLSQWDGVATGETYLDPVLSGPKDDSLTGASRAVDYPWYIFKLGEPTEYPYTRYVRISDIISAKVDGRVWKWDTTGVDDAYFNINTILFSRDDFIDGSSITKSKDNSTHVGSSDYKNVVKAQARVMIASDIDPVVAKASDAYCKGQPRRIN